MPTPNQIAGEQWAAQVIAKKVDSGDLPNIGRGFTPMQRACRAVSGIADRKLFTGKLANPLSKQDREFWTAVLHYAANTCTSTDGYEESEINV